MLQSTFGAIHKVRNRKKLQIVPRRNCSVLPALINNPTPWAVGEVQSSWVIHTHFTLFSLTQFYIPCAALLRYLQSSQHHAEFNVLRLSLGDASVRRAKRTKYAPNNLATSLPACIPYLSVLCTGLEGV